MGARTAIIVPSIRLKSVGVHKIQDHMTCGRLYFWKWVLNLIPRRINIAFWFGSVMHKANEFIPLVGTMPLKKLLPIIYKAMEKESKRASRGYIISPNIADEMALQFEIGKIMIAFYLRHFKDSLEEFKIIGTEVHFTKKLKQSPVIFQGTIDAYGKIGKRLALKEIKTAARISKEYFARLKFDKQINGYAIGVHEIEGRYPSYCPYTVFRKPGIRVRKNETVPQFLKRLKGDLKKRADWYYIVEPLRFGKQSIYAVLQDIEQETFDMNCKYDFFKIKDLLDPVSYTHLTLPTSDLV